MSDAQGPIVLTSPRRTSLIMLFGSLAFVAVGVVLAVSGDTQVGGWLAALFFGACSIVFVWQVIVPGKLVISPSTIEFSQLGRHWSRDLARCGPFEVWHTPVGSHSMVVFDHPDDAVRRLSGASRRLAGHTSVLPDTFGMPAADLAQMLNEARDRALRTTG